MPPAKTPTSSLSVIELLAKRFWYRTLARVQKMRSGGASPETSTALSPPAVGLPQEIIRSIINYIAYDTHTLRACTLTCYSWYIAAAPHLHYTHAIETRSLDQRFWRPNPLWSMHMLGLLPLVRKLRVIDNSYGHHVWLSKALFNRRVLHPFLAFTNLRKLEMDFLDIPSFLPNIRRYFGHFPPTVRSLTLREPKGSRREIIYFIGLFQHLQDLGFRYGWGGSKEEPADDPTLTPPFIPPLRGWLRLTYFTRMGLLEDMINLFGGIRFRFMSLYSVRDTRVPLDACAKTLEVLVLELTDPYARFFLQDFDLSQNKALRTLQFPASPTYCDMNNGSPTALGFLKYVLSTITSSAFFQIIVIYHNQDFNGIKPRGSDWPPFRELSEAERAEEASRHGQKFEMLRELYKIRDFQLVLSASVSGCVAEYATQMLEEAVAEEKAKNGFDDHFPEPVVLYDPHRIQRPDPWIFLT